MDNKDEFNDGQLEDFNIQDNIDPNEVNISDYFPFEDKNTSARYFYWKDMVHGGFTYTDIALRITDNDVCTFTLIVKQTRKFYTHTRNRRSWTGPYLTVTLLDRGKVPVGDPMNIGQINRICTQRDDRVTKSFTIAGSHTLASSGTFSASAYRSTNC